MSAAALATIRETVRRRSGIVLTAEKDYLVTSRLEPLLPKLGSPSLVALAEVLARQPESRAAVEVTDALTTNETLWFRDGKPFELVRTVVLPDLVARAEKGRPISFWSAACSTGQEPYSLAILLSEEMPRIGAPPVKIVGTDISTAALTRAKEARYSHFEMQRGLSVHRLVKCFDKQGNDWVLKPHLRSMVEFRQTNLLALPPLGPFDLVMCRNVLIYFDVETKRRVLEGVAKRMRPGGWLQLGAAETTVGLDSTFVPVAGHPSLYRRAG
jgi:chemotaxis protein methyltransferase CheR